jgi:hypothetical protein
VGQSLPYLGGFLGIAGVLGLYAYGGHSWVPLVGWVVLSIIGYWVSLFTNPDRRCWGCNGSSRFYGAVFGYASRACKYCGGSGRRPRWGRRFIDRA